LSEVCEAVEFMAGMQLKEGEVTSTIYGLVSFICSVFCRMNATFCSD